MKRFFKPTKGGRYNQAAATQPGAAPAAQPAETPGAPAQGMGGKGRRRAVRMSGKGATRPTGNLMQPHQTPLNQPISGQYGAGVGQNQQPNIM